MENLTKTVYSLEDWQESHPIAMRALYEEQTDGIVSILCPKCGFHPEVLMTLDGSRTYIRCKCGYVTAVEINL